MAVKTLVVYHQTVSTTHAFVVVVAAGPPWQLKKKKKVVENGNRGARTIPIRKHCGRVVRANEGRFTIFFLPKPFLIANLRNLEKTEPENTI